MSLSDGFVPSSNEVVRKVVLHIGPPKTGTSVLQHTLAENRRFLSDQGFLYPGLRPSEASRWSPRRGEPTGVKHDHLLLLALADPRDMLVYRRLGLSPESLDEVRRECLNSFENELKSESPECLILSSESFGNLAVNPTDHMRELAEYVSRLAGAVEVVLYARHPVALSRSRQQQLLKSGMDTLDRLDSPWIFPYRRALTVLRELFGRSAVRVIAYERDYNPAFDTVASFAAVAGLDPSGFVSPPRRQNSSLSMEGALLADALTREFPQPEAMAGEHHPRRARPGWMATIRGAPFRLSPATEVRIMERAAPDLELLKVEYGIEFPALPDAEVPLWGAETVRSLAITMNRLAKQAEAVR